MKTLLKHITTIQTGLFARPTGKGTVVYLQARQFNEYGQLSATLHPDLMAEGISEKHLLKNGDVLFATSFFVIRLSDQEIMPEYLAWFLNSHTAQTILKGRAIGTSIPSISNMLQTISGARIGCPAIMNIIVMILLINLLYCMKPFAAMYFWLTTLQ